MYMTCNELPKPALCTTYVEISRLCPHHDPEEEDAASEMNKEINPPDTCCGKKRHLNVEYFHGMLVNRTQGKERTYRGCFKLCKTDLLYIPRRITAHRTQTIYPTEM